MKKILTIILILFTFNVFAQEPIVGNWKFTLDHKIDVKDLIKEANKLGATFSDDDINFVYGITVIYVLGRCENSEIMISDFENTVFAAYPDLAGIKQLLYDNGADYAAMSGSGSTIFGVYKLRDQAEKTGRLLGDKYKFKLARPVG